MKFPEVKLATCIISAFILRLYARVFCGNAACPKAQAALLLIHPVLSLQLAAPKDRVQPPQREALPQCGHAESRQPSGGIHPSTWGERQICLWRWGSRGQWMRGGGGGGRVTSTRAESRSPTETGDLSLEVTRSEAVRIKIGTLGLEDNLPLSSMHTSPLQHIPSWLSCCTVVRIEGFIKFSALFGLLLGFHKLTRFKIRTTLGVPDNVLLNRSWNV